MAHSSVTPAQRRRRILRDALLLAAVLAVLMLRMGFPIFTSNQALAATQARYFFGPGEVVAVLDDSQSRLISWLAARPQGGYDRYYILRWGDWYAWCGVNHYGPFWQSGALDAVENDPDTPLVPLVVSHWKNGAVLVVCNDPDIARVEIEFPVLTDSGYLLATAVQDQRAEDYFLIRQNLEEAVLLYPEALRLWGFDRNGNLLYESPVPESWAEEYSITDPDSWRFRYDASYFGEVGA